MIKELQYVSINRVIDELLRHPMLSDLTLEQAISYTLSFIAYNGLPKFYEDKIVDVDIHDFRGLLPCDLISIIQVKDKDTRICLRSMTDNFTKGMMDKKGKHHHDKMKIDAEGNVHPHRHHPLFPPYIPPLHRYMEEPSFKIQGRVIYTSFPEGIITVAYKSIPVDEHGYPMLWDNEVYLGALKAYIKQEMFTIKFDMGELSGQVLQNAKQEYCWRAGQLNSEFMIPSVSEMESIARMWNTMIPKVREFDNGFRDLGDREFLRRHQGLQ